MKKVLFTLLLVDIFLAFIIYVWKGQVWLINSQIAFLSSSLIMLASMQSHKNMVSNALTVGAVGDDDRDTLDKLEDPYGLYDEDDKEERGNLKKQSRSVWETTKDAKASFSFYRLSAYALLVLGFFYLNGNDVLELIPYLSFLGIPLFVVVYTLVDNNDK